jgi:hypothetical protein
VFSASLEPFVSGVMCKVASVARGASAAPRAAVLVKRLGRPLQFNLMGPG